jgi:hypothetical protein
MNVFDYLFLDLKDPNKDFILGPVEQVSYKKIYQAFINEYT